MDDPRTHAEREAAQRADEAELQAGLLATLPPIAGGSDTCKDCGVMVQPGAARCFTCSATIAIEILATKCSRCGHEEVEHSPGCTRRTPRSDLATYKACPCARFVVWPEEDIKRERLHRQQAAAVLAARGLPPMAGGAMTEAESRVYAMEQQAKRDAAMRADPDYHEGPAIYRLNVPTGYATILCPVGHLVTSRKLDKTWGGSAFEADWGKLRVIQCIGTLPRAREHTHPCPTCHQARPCTGTGCADGPRECTTCSNCRGW